MDKKISARKQRLETCGAETCAIHLPILDLHNTGGFLNPAGLGDAALSLDGLWGQSTVAFESQAEFRGAEKTGRSLYGGPEYGVVGSADANEVCEKFAALHGGKGAVILSSGLNAITNVFITYLEGPAPTILLPDNRYYPAERALKRLSAIHPGLAVYHYAANADGAEIESLLARVRQEGRNASLLYLEAPGSQTYEIPAINDIIAIAKNNGIKTVMDNSWASHVRFKPIAHGIDIVIQATTKYEGGYADTPSGIIIAASEDDYKTLARTSRIFGTGAVAPSTCRRLNHRVDSTQSRMDRHYQSALKIIDWMQAQPFTDKILCPALPQSPDHARFLQYFGKGNGLLTTVFKPDISASRVEQFLDNLLLFRAGESWGGHVSLAQPARPTRILTDLPTGQMVRFSIGLEDPSDLLIDLEHAAQFLL